MSSETDQLEADVNESRHRLSDTLDQLGSKLSPGQMLDEALGLAQGQAGQFTANLGRQLRDNPLPSVLIAAGVALYFMKNRQDPGAQKAHWSAHDWENDRRHRSLEEIRWSTQKTDSETDDAFSERLHTAHAKALDLRQNAGEAIDQFKQRVAGAVNETQKKAKNTQDRLTRSFAGAAHSVGEGVQTLQDKTGEAARAAQNFYADTPIVGGAIALAVGALVGAMTPLSDAERNSLSGLAGKANDAGAALAERSARMAEQAADSIH